jgi:purine-nucleoside/S-methyl-5'-thioadenosine phosphorylase / adenosine deaminase
VDTSDPRTIEPVRAVSETRTEVPPGVTHPEWAERFPWLIQGTTGRGDPEEPFDLRLMDGRPPEDTEVLERWQLLWEAIDVGGVLYAKQIHGALVRFHRKAAEGIELAGECDGHATATPGAVLAVSVADCVPVFVVDNEHRAVAVLHAGWRGAAAGVLESGLGTLRGHAGSRIENLYVHLGPAICGDCYEVGPEVFEALELPSPERPEPVDLRAVLAGRAVAAGVRPGRLTVSAHCTLCGEGRFFSHRGGDAGRQLAYIGIRE